MDFVKIALSNLVESLFNIITIIYDFVTQLVLSSYNNTDQFLQLDSLSSISSNITGFAYALLTTVVLISMIKMYIVEEGDIQLSDLLFKVTMTIVAIAVTPQVIDLIINETYDILTKISTVSSSKSVDFSSVNIIELIENMDKIALAGSLVLLVVFLICFVTIFILVIQTAMMSVFLVFLKMLSSLAALSFMSNYPSLYIILIKDVISIMLTRIIQIACLRLSLDMIIDAVSSFVTEFGKLPSFATINLCVTSLALMLAILFIPGMFKKYTGADATGSAIPKATAAAIGLAIKKF